MPTGAIHPGGLPPQTERKIALRLEALLAENAVVLAKAGWFKRRRLQSTLEAQAFQEVTGCDRLQWNATRVGGSVIH
ncbi:MAG: hypothetical protein EBS05_00355 [Proteobacteria bacterium]|nr:hypothetical protein [Pseudomonadota bacterium]